MEFRSKLHMHVRGVCFRDAQRSMANTFKEGGRKFENVSDLVSTCLVFHNMCIFFGDKFWREEWMRGQTNEVHNGLAIEQVQGAATLERIVVANLAFHNLAGIDDQTRETLEYIK